MQYSASDKTIKQKSSRGFSLIELMIALVIGLLVLLGASQLFVISKRNYDRVEILSERQQSLRAIFDFISTDIRTAAKVVQATDGLLELAYYGSRSGDPYCVNDGGSLDNVKYTYSEGVVSIAVDCGSGYIASNPLLSSLASPPVYSAEDGSHVNVRVAFHSMPDEPAGNEKFDFVVAQRCVAFNSCASGE